MYLCLYAYGRRLRWCCIQSDAPKIKMDDDAMVDTRYLHERELASIVRDENVRDENLK